MEEHVCTSCGGTGKQRRGTFVGPVDPAYDWFARQGPRDWLERSRDVILALKPGDKVTVFGDFTRTVVDVGMYDGWPYWQPTPAFSYVGPLGGIEIAFWRDIMHAGGGGWE